MSGSTADPSVERVRETVAARLNAVGQRLTANRQSLLDTLQGLQTIGKAFLGGAKGPEKAVYSRMIDNAKFVRNNNEVTLDLSVPQSDIDILIGSIK